MRRRREGGLRRGELLLELASELIDPGLQGHGALGVSRGGGTGFQGSVEAVLDDGDVSLKGNQTRGFSCVDQTAKVAAGAALSRGEQVGDDGEGPC